MCGYIAIGYKELTLLRVALHHMSCIIYQDLCYIALHIFTSCIGLNTL